MSNYVENLHTAKENFLKGMGSYATVAQAVCNEFQSDTKSIESILVKALNNDYPIIETRDNAALKTALNSCQKAFKKAGESLADGKNGKLVFTFTTTGGKDSKTRSVTVKHLTADQVQVEAERQKQDEAIKAERAEQDAKLEEDKQRMMLQQLSDLDVFLRIKQDIANTYPDHDIKKVLAAGLAWFADQEKAKTAKPVQPAKQAVNS